MSGMEDPAVLAERAARLASEMEGDRARCVDVAYQLLTGQQRIGELDRELVVERRRLEACLQSMSSGQQDAGPIRQAFARALPALMFFVAGMVAFALLTFLLSVAKSRFPERSVPTAVTTGR